MRAVIDAALSNRPEGESAPASDAVLLLYLDVLTQTMDDLDADGQVAAASITSDMAYFEDRVVRFRLARVERLAWQVAVDPLGLSGDAGGGPQTVPALPRRTFRIRDDADDRMDARRERPPTSEPRVAVEESALLHVVDVQSVEGERVRLGDLPAGTVLVDATDDAFDDVLAIDSE